MPISDYIKNLRSKIGNDLLLIPGVTAVVINDRDEVLLQLRRDTKTWAPPSGGLEPGENLAQCVIREVREETGVEVTPEAIIAVLSGKEFIWRYPNGDQVAAVSTVFRRRPHADTLPRVNDDESLEIRFSPCDNLPNNMLQRHRQIISQALEKNPRAFFNEP